MTRKTSRTSAGNKATVAIGNTIAEMEKVADFVDQFGAAQGIGQGITNDLNLCLDGLLNNTISYGYGDQKRHYIVVSLSIADGMVIVEIQDDGRPFDPRSPIPSVDYGTVQSRRIGGRGRLFVKALMDEMDYIRLNQFNVVTIKKKLPTDKE